MSAPRRRAPILNLTSARPPHLSSYASWLGRRLSSLPFADREQFLITEIDALSRRLSLSRRALRSHRVLLRSGALILPRRSIRATTAHVSSAALVFYDP